MVELAQRLGLDLADARRHSNLSTAFIRPMLPSWIRSRNCRPRLVHFSAIEITRRRFASTISFFAWRASRSPFYTTKSR